jgi:spermidine synthase
MIALPGLSPETTPPSRTMQEQRQPFLPLLLILFIGSGCSALIYEVVWLQLLQLVIGSTAASLAVLLGTFMGGMCLGSLVLPRLISPREHPLRVYALLELGTAIFGLMVLFGMPWIQTLYTAGASMENGGSWIPAIVLRSLACAICLLPPTVMMGATLPAISRWIEHSPEAASWWGFFYGGNIAGGVAGCLLAGFYLLRVHDMAVASYVAVAINVVVAGLGLALAGALPYQCALVETSEEAAPRGWSVYAAIALSGLGALGAEVVWTRLLSLMLGGTVYTFSIILGVFLAGLGIGSSGGSFIARKAGPERARMWLAGCQAAQVLAILYAGVMLASVLPYWKASLGTTSGIWLDFARDLLRCAIGILPSTILWGAAFPLALASVAGVNLGAKGDSGKLVGEVYAANTIGAILGSVGFSLLFIPGVGTQHSEQILMVVSVTAALIAWPTPSVKLALAAAVAAMLAWGIPATPWKLIGFGRTMATQTSNWQLLYAADGMNSSIAYSKWNGQTTYFHVSGKVEASAEPQDMRLQRLLGHLPALLHKNPKSVLVVGCGAGVTAGSFVVHPEIEHITICEIEPRIPPASALFFSEENHNVMHDKRTRIVYDDARHFVLTTRDKFDIITSDPIHPFVKGIAPLYSTEYFELCKQHLNPGGFVTQWVPLYESNLETVQSELATFFEAFPHGSVWGNLNIDGSGYDVVLLGQAEDLKVDLDSIDARLKSAPYQAVAKSMQTVGYYSAADLMGTYVVKADDLRNWLRNAQINRDRNLRLQYLAGLGLNEYLAPEIFQQIVQHSREPGEMFTGSPERMRELEAALHRQRNP